MTDKLIFYRSGISGGTATLSLRMSSFLLNEFRSIIYICEEINSENNKAKFIESGIKVVCNSFINNKRYILAELTDPNNIFLVYSFWEYKKLTNLLPRKLKNNVILYHVADQVIGLGRNNFPIKEFVKTLLNRKTIKTMYFSNRILFFSQEDEKKSLTKYSIKKIEQSYFPIPIECDNFSESFILHNNKKRLKIVSVARSDYPFKGYVFPLVDCFEKMKHDGFDIELTLITSNDDKNNLLEKRIDSLNEDCKSSINLLFDVDYSVTKTIISKSNVLVGMGTTLIDAGSVSVPSIVACDYSYFGKTEGYFFETNILASCENKSELSFYECLAKLVCLSDEDYKEYCLKSHNLVLLNYSAQSFKKNFMNVVIKILNSNN